MGLTIDDFVLGQEGVPLGDPLSDFEAKHTLLA